MHTAIHKNMVLKKIAGLPFYTEGPAMDDQGNYYCTTLSGGTILQINVNGLVKEWANSVCPNGQIIVPGGDHLICDSKLGLVRRFDASGKFVREETSPLIQGQQVQVPNDLIMDQLGNIYFTDSVRYHGKVYCIKHDGEQIILATGLDYPNGILLSADESRLYVAESYQNRIIQFELDEPGKVTRPYTVFASLPAHASGKLEQNLPDGIAFNTAGKMGVAHYGMQAVQMFSGAGAYLYSIDTQMPYTSNLIFLDEFTLLVTGGYGEPGPGALYMINIHD